MMLLRLTLAAAAGALVGYERERAGKRAGMRTMALVGMGAAVFTMAGAFGFTDGELRDPARVAAQVATGVGFIGAGTILTSGNMVRGLTTAAAIWVSAALGLASGAGLYALTVAGAVLSVIVLALFPRFSEGDD